MIHSTAIIDKSVKVGRNVKVGPYAIIEGDVEIHDDVEIMSHVSIKGRTVIGAGTKIYPFATIGYAPQDLKFANEKSSLIIGKNNSIREYVTMHPGTKDGIMKTVVGDDNLFMVGVHIAHDCVIGSHVVMGNQAMLGGHVSVEDHVIIGGLVAVHQWVRIGRYAMIGGMSGVERDVIPYGAVKGERASLHSINIIGMQRAEYDKKDILTLKKAYDIIFSSNGIMSENITQIEHEIKNVPCVDYLVEFLKSKTNRSFCLPKENK